MLFLRTVSKNIAIYRISWRSFRRILIFCSLLLKMHSITFSFSKKRQGKTQVLALLRQAKFSNKMLFWMNFLLSSGLWSTWGRIGFSHNFLPLLGRTQDIMARCQNVHWSGVKTHISYRYYHHISSKWKKRGIPTQNAVNHSFFNQLLYAFYLPKRARPSPSLAPSWAAASRCVADERPWGCLAA